MSHTPGPWMLNGWDIVQRDCDDSFPPIAIVGNARRTLTLEEIDANARLIAAAPDLLAACEALCDRLTGWMDGTAADDDDRERQDEAALDMADAAIAKAEGRE